MRQTVEKGLRDKGRGRQSRKRVLTLLAKLRSRHPPIPIMAAGIPAALDEARVVAKRWVVRPHMFARHLRHSGTFPTARNIFKNGGLLRLAYWEKTAPRRGQPGASRAFLWLVSLARDWSLLAIPFDHRFDLNLGERCTNHSKLLHLCSAPCTVVHLLPPWAASRVQIHDKLSDALSDLHSHPPPLPAPGWDPCCCMQADNGGLGCGPSTAAAGRSPAHGRARRRTPALQGCPPGEDEPVGPAARALHCGGAGGQQCSRRLWPGKEGCTKRLFRASTGTHDRAAAAVPDSQRAQLPRRRCCTGLLLAPGLASKPAKL